MDKLTPKAVIFDLGSTLIEYEKVPWTKLLGDCIKSVGEYLINQGIELPNEEKFYKVFCDVRDKYRKIGAETLVEWSIPVASQEVLNRLDIRDENGLADKMFDAFYKPVEKQLYVYDDSKETLEKIKKTGLTIGLISNTIFPDRAHLGELKKYELLDYIDFTIFSSSYGLRKPHSDIFLQAANQAGFAPSECVYIGDRYIEDITGPNSVGMPAVLKVVDYREYPDDMPDNIRKIDNISELFEPIKI
jgi:putative hydrolase of the HAD superfamily